MVGKSPITADGEQRAALRALAHSRDRCEADRARAMLLTLLGWTSPRIAEAFGVREDTVRLWRCDFADGGVEALKASVAPGPAPVKSGGRAARRRACFWKLPSPAGAIEGRSRPDQRDRVARGRQDRQVTVIQDAAKKTSAGGGAHSKKGRQIAGEIARVGLHFQLHKATARNRRNRPALWRRE